MVGTRTSKSARVHFFWDFFFENMFSVVVAAVAVSQSEIIDVGSKVISRVNPRYASWTVDASYNRGQASAFFWG